MENFKIFLKIWKSFGILRTILQRYRPGTAQCRNPVEVFFNRALKPDKVQGAFQNRNL